jgi:hypothetical protein
MGFESRVKLIKEIGKLRNSAVISYITSDRPGPVSAKIAMDVIPLFYNHLKKLGHSKKIDLFIYSLGGDTMAPLRLVHLLREFCDKFGVLVAYKAHSAATLVAIGADEIVMGPLGELSPIDPTITTAFNPPHPENPQEPKVEISIEDVMSFVNLAKEKVGLSDQDNLVRVFEKLTERIHPLALGGVYRSHALIRLMAEKLLKLHTKDKEKSQRISQIVDKLAEKLYYHAYLITRTEAEELGLKIVKPQKDLEDLMWNLYSEYETAMELGRPFNPFDYIRPELEAERVDKEFDIAFIESEKLVHRGCKKLRILKTLLATPAPSPIPGPPVQIQVQDLGFEWKIEKVEVKEVE